MTKKEILFDRLYKKMCCSCPRAKQCHEDCETCEKFDNELDALMKKPLNDNSLKDFLNRSVVVGDKVILLVKRYGFMRIDRAYLQHATYLGRGKYGYEFKLNSVYHNGFIVRIREPQLVLYPKKGGK